MDGVGRVERSNVSFMREAPTGGFAEFALVSPKNIIPVPEQLDDITAAAIANPGLSAVGALVYRAKLQPGDTVLINGATGSAGTICTQIAKQLGAGEVIVTGRKQAELDRLKTIGATQSILFNMDEENGPQNYEAALTTLFATQRVNVVVDYLWGPTARTILSAIARGNPDSVRFVQVGAAAGIDSIDLPAAALRSSSVEMMGSGFKSIAFTDLFQSVATTFDIASKTPLSLTTKVVPLEEVEANWAAGEGGRARIVFQISKP